MDADLVLEGGGVKGIGLVGAVKVFTDAGYQFRRVAGTSAGAIVGSLAAAGVPAAQLERIMHDVDYRKFQDGNLLTRLGRPGAAVQVLLHKGVYMGDWLHDWVAGQLADAGVRTWGDLRITQRDDPGSALEPTRSYKLVVIVSDISDNKLLRLPWDYGRLGVGPAQVDELPVADAVRASASIPFFFQPCMLKVPGRGGQVYLTDGGMLSNFPIDVFDRRDAQRPRWPTFGVKLSARPTANQLAPAPSIRGVVRFSLALVATMANAHDQMHLDDPSVVDRTVFVDTFGVKSTDFHLDARTRDQLFDKGMAAGKKFLADWSFDGYLDKYWKPATAEGAGAPAAGDAAAAGGGAPAAAEAGDAA
ncbi:MAG TPA: patatin-like phospholipase family protein [Actinomycetota bacterium]|jgi:NTE family protein|nr:patatin-like phospholipase family protein [Actinomycetota bacterium]